MDRTVTYQISEQEEGLTVLEYLRRNGFSRHILSAMKTDKDAILLNGLHAGGRTLLREGDLLRIHVPETESGENIVPVPMRLSILYEDQDMLVVNKPADMPVHPSYGNYENTLANGVSAYFQAKGINCPFRCINRLDRDTSGALILAKNALSASILSSQMKNRLIRRTYLAVVKGIAPEKGTVSAPISRVSSSVIKRQVDFAEGDPAVTHFERLAVSHDHSLLEIHLETNLEMFFDIS